MEMKLWVGDTISVYAVQNLDKEKRHTFVDLKSFSIGFAHNIDDAGSKAVFETELEIR